MFNDEEHQEAIINEEKSKNTIENKKAGKKERKPLFTKPQNMGVFIIICLLILQILMSGFQLYRGIRQDVERSQLIASVNKYTTNADALTTQMLSDYKADVYNNANVNSTEKQQVMGNEYNFMAQMLLAKQNSRLLELLAQLKQVQKNCFIRCFCCKKPVMNQPAGLFLLVFCLKISIINTIFQMFGCIDLKTIIWSLARVTLAHGFREQIAKPAFWSVSF